MLIRHGLDARRRQTVEARAQLGGGGWRQRFGDVMLCDDVREGELVFGAGGVAADGAHARSSASTEAIRRDARAR